MNPLRQCRLIVIGLLLCGAAYGASYPLKISSTNPRILVDQQQVPFLMVGDSPHSLFSNLSSADAAAYLADRAARGINSLWVNLLCVRPVEGRPDGSLLDGTRPFVQALSGTEFYDLTTPNEAYFAHVDEVMRMAATNGIVVMIDPLETAGPLLPTALANGSTRCRAYGQYLGSRYKDFPNIVWLHGNDFQKWSVATNDAVITSVALGIKDKDANHLHTIELNYQSSSSLDDPNWAPIVGLNLAYTYYATYAEVLHGYNQSPNVPVFMGEANFEYETNGVAEGAEDGGSPHILRMQEYWTMLSGATGQLYGNRYIWRFLPGWQSHLDSPGIVQLGYMENLFSGRKWYDLVPDQSPHLRHRRLRHFRFRPSLARHSPTICRQRLCDRCPDAGRLAGHGLSAARRDDHGGDGQAAEWHHRPLVRPLRQHVPGHCRLAVFQRRQPTIHRRPARTAPATPTGYWYWKRYVETARS